ncbi:NAD(P)H-dependent oxidoreductase [Streptomyces lonarensis]|uniref:NAD(P)H-dependent oxidoreductase n=1 Tax=Streptomyces lonarensis TaxID=700599 RepID=A0A7X6CZN0_9ACTN|nr:NAD(P)H-dependent oxidoreductase [Streptomyces lonarensis]NJQ05389.1 NAD(P)H-dependent oxidoreductase [Streptomyces lonarensis]
MKLLWLYAHPEPRSLNGHLRTRGIAAATALGHAVVQSDLYAMGWNPVVSRADHPDGDGRFRAADASHAAFRAGRLPVDVAAEQEKLLGADAVVVQFPLWWYGPPAILKGWFDRVLVKGLGYGTGSRYGAGALAGKRALTVVTAGARESSLAPRGIHGSLDQILWPLLHGTYFYTGMAPLRPLLVGSADRLTEAEAEAAADALADRLRGLGTERPLAFRAEASGDYDERLRLRHDIAPGELGLEAHLGGST